MRYLRNMTYPNAPLAPGFRELRGEAESDPMREPGMTDGGVIIASRAVIAGKRACRHCGQRAQRA
jgi:hypothetical protein